MLAPCLPVIVSHRSLYTYSPTSFFRRRRRPQSKRHPKQPQHRQQKQSDMIQAIHQRGKNPSGMSKGGGTLAFGAVTEETLFLSVGLCDITVDPPVGSGRQHST